MTSITPAATGVLLLLILSACAQREVADRGNIENSHLSLAETSWTVERLREDSGPALQELTLTFAENGRVSGHDGCNAFSGNVSVGETSIHIGDKLIGTMMACSDAIEARARTYRAALMQTARYRTQGNTLQLVDSAGNVLVTLSPVEQSLAGSSWDVISYNNGKQALVSLIAGTKITARFGEDGRITGHAGCNGYFASYKVTEQRMAIGPPASTRKACAEPEGVMEQERFYLRALEMATQYQFSGKRLELRNIEGALVAAFVRGG